MQGWRQLIADTMRERCTHDSPVGGVSSGCHWCQQTYIKVLAIIDEALVDLTQDLINTHTSTDAVYRIQTFKRDVPHERL